MQTDNRFFRRPQTVVAYTGGARLAAAKVAPFATEMLLSPGRSGRCVTRRELCRTAVPYVVVAGSADGCALGLRFVRLRHVEP
jgi:hypothetical protein